jgi:hypothetical protein
MLTEWVLFRPPDPSFSGTNGDAQQLCSASRCASRALLHQLSRSLSALPFDCYLGRTAPYRT